MISGLVAHLWQSTLFAGAAWLLTLALRKNSAQVRYRIWFIASVKFLIPFSLLVGLGTLVPRRATVLSVQPRWVGTAEQIGQPLLTLPAITERVTPKGAGVDYLTAAVAIVWACGFAAIAIVWLVRWKRVHTLRKSAAAVRMDFPVPVMCAPGSVEPGIFGILRPILLLPEGIENRLDAAQLDAILAHELCHVRRATI